MNIYIFLNSKETEHKKLNCHQNNTWNYFTILITAIAKLAIDAAVAIIIIKIIS